MSDPVMILLDEAARERLRDAIGEKLALVPGLEDRHDFGPLVDGTAGAALRALELPPAALAIPVPGVYGPHQVERREVPHPSVH